MPIHLYKFSGEQFEMVGLSRVPLAGKDGALNRFLSENSKEGGAWHISAADIMNRTKATQELGENMAIIDDLVPSGPETLLGKIAAIRGFQEVVRPFAGYVPLVFEFEIVKHIPRERSEDERERKRIKEEHEKITKRFMPDDNRPRVLSFSYLWKPKSVWVWGGPMKHALLWPRQWEWLKGI